jgi:hypothetical protein
MDAQTVDKAGDRSLPRNTRGRPNLARLPVRVVPGRYRVTLQRCHRAAPERRGAGSAALKR